MNDDDMYAMNNAQEEEKIMSRMNNYDVVKVEQQSIDWFLARCGRITGSDANILFMNGRGKEPSLVKLAYARKIAYERMYGDPIISDMNNIKPVSHGNEYESFAINEYQKNNNTLIQRVGFLSVDRGEYAGTIGCSPDGLIGDDGMIEVKCPFNQEKHLSFFYEGMNEKDWIIQAKFNMFVAEREWIDFMSYDPRRSFEMRCYIKRIHRDVDFESELKAKIEEFELMVKDATCILMEFRHKKSIDKEQ